MKPNGISDNRNSVWSTSNKVEENGYYWKDKPVLNKRPLSKSSKPRVVELFSGCGGTSKGFEMAGFEIVLGADIHEPSIKTFHHNHKNATTLLGNLKNISASKLTQVLGSQKIDVMIAGVPCQGFSLNNRKRFKDDERNYLFKEYIRFVKDVQPKVVMLENVSGMKSTANGAFVEAIEKAIRKIGYPIVTHKMLNAADYGVPQIRHRLVFIGTKDGIEFEWPKKPHGPKTALGYQTVRDAIGDLPMIDSDQEAKDYAKPAETRFQKLMRASTKELTNHKAPKHPAETIEKIRNTKPGEPMYPKFKQRIRLSWDRPSTTQVSGGIRPQFQFGHPERARGLTVRERCRIQSFPDDFEVLGGTVQGRVQTGNAVPPLLAKAIATQVKKALRKTLNQRSEVGDYYV